MYFVSDAGNHNETNGICVSATGGLNSERDFLTEIREVDSEFKQINASDNSDVRSV
jgi:hypothetical protein